MGGFEFTTREPTLRELLLVKRMIADPTDMESIVLLMQSRLVDQSMASRLLSVSCSDAIPLLAACMAGIQTADSLFKLNLTSLDIVT